VAISLGHDPALFAAALISDRGYGFAGWMRGAPVEVTQGESSGLPIPAAAEAVLEGEIAAPAAGQQPAAPTVKIQSMLFRSEPMILGNPPCPGAHYGVLSSKAAFVWNELEALGIPNIAAVNHYGWGCAIVAIKQPYPGHVKRVAHAVLGSSVGRDVRLVIVVDDDIDPYNLEKVFWAIATRYEPEFALDIVRRLWSDGSERTGFTNQKGGASNSTTIIDACRPYHWMDKFPRTTDISEELFRKTDKKWRKVLSQHR
jgi:4-hydroxy-3-polyprenylbenzoate decarboxylase